MLTKRILNNDTTANLTISDIPSNLEKKRIKKESIIFSTGSLIAKIGVKRPLSLTYISEISFIDVVDIVDI